MEIILPLLGGGEHKKQKIEINKTHLSTAFKKIESCKQCVNI